MSNLVPSLQDLFAKYGEIDAVLKAECDRLGARNDPELKKRFDQFTDSNFSAHQEEFSKIRECAHQQKDIISQLERRTGLQADTVFGLELSGEFRGEYVTLHAENLHEFPPELDSLRGLVGKAMPTGAVHNDVPAPKTAPTPKAPEAAPPASGNTIKPIVTKPVDTPPTPSVRPSTQDRRIELNPITVTPQGSAPLSSAANSAVAGASETHTSLESLESAHREATAAFDQACERMYGRPLGEKPKVLREGLLKQISTPGHQLHYEWKQLEEARQTLENVRTQTTPVMGSGVHSDVPVPTPPAAKPSSATPPDVPSPILTNPEGVTATGEPASAKPITPSTPAAEVPKPASSREKAMNRQREKYPKDFNAEGRPHGFNAPYDETSSENRAAIKKRKAAMREEKLKNSSPKTEAPKPPAPPSTPEPLIEPPHVTPKPSAIEEAAVDAGKAVEASEGLWTQLRKLSPVKKTAIGVGVAAATAGISWVAYEALREKKPEKSEHTTGAGR